MALSKKDRTQAIATARKIVGALVTSDRPEDVGAQDELYEYPEDPGLAASYYLKEFPTATTSGDFYQAFKVEFAKAARAARGVE